MEPDKRAEITVSPIEQINVTLKGCIGVTLRVRANLGRSKISEYEGIVTEAHEQLFVVEVRRKRGSVERKSYQYVDVLTRNVVLMYAESNELLFPEAFKKND
jgi:uncharacterized protein Veg